MFKQVILDYALDAFEPHIDALTMDTHYNKHHATYTKNFNEFVEKASLTGKSAEEILSNLDALPQELRGPIRNNGGGYWNHNMYFKMLSPKGGALPAGALADRINADFGSFSGLKEQMTKAAMGQFGSGWAWLAAKKDGSLYITTTSNQETPINNGETGVLLALDVWEHAYYLKYKNLRPDYIAAFWNVVDWNKVAKRYDEVNS